MKQLVMQLKKRQRIALAGAAVAGALVIVAATVLIWSQPSASAVSAATATPSPSPTETPSPIPTPTWTPTLEPGFTLSAGQDYSDLDGVPAAAARAHALPMAIMIDDQPAGRPQSGFSAASIVWQAPADGQATRYMMVFQEWQSEDIGPVRSGRPYFVYWGTEYRGIYGHVGGDLVTRAQVVPALAASGYLYNMDDIYGGWCAYHRITTRHAPHNDYTSWEQMRACANRKGYPKTANGLAKRLFIADAQTVDRPATGTIALAYPKVAISYTYDPYLNAYLRSVDGAKQVDAATGQRVVARNVMVLFQGFHTDWTSEPGHIRPVMENIGSGKALVFRNGEVIKAKWKKKSKTDTTRLYDSSGKEIGLLRGRTFIQVVKLDTKVNYSFE